MKNLWLGVALALGVTLVYLGLGSEVTKEIQSWRYSAPQDQAASAPVEDKGVTGEKGQDQELGSKETINKKEDVGVSSEKEPEVAEEQKEEPTAAPLPGEDKMDDLVKSLKSQDSSSFFAEYRLERDRVRGQQSDLLKEMAQSSSSPEDTRKAAYGKLLSINQSVGKELELEQLLKAKNFEDAVVVMHDDAVTIVVKSSDLSQKELTIITDLATRTTGRSAKDVIIVPKS